MKSTSLGFVAILALVFGTPVQAQDEQGLGDFNGIPSSVLELVDGWAQDLGAAYREAVRLGSLTRNDIRMKMRAQPEASAGGIGLGQAGAIILWEETPLGEDELYAEFDWANLAMSMRMKSEGSDGSLWVLGEELDASQEATDITMYFDAAGTVYVPTGDGNYVSANLPNMFGQMTGALQSIDFDSVIESSVGEQMDALAFILGGALMEIPPGYLDVGIQELMEEYISSGGADGILQELQDQLESLTTSEFEAISAFPLVNFAFVFSPDGIRSSIDVQEETVTWQGREDSTRMTITSGEDAGYVFVFDRYGRLAHLRDTDGSTATYWYDRDVTVP